MNKLKKFTTPLLWFSALLLIALAAGCNSGSDPILGGSGGGGSGGGENAPIVVDSTAPTIIRVSELDGTTELMPLNRDITATFSEAMDPATLISASPSTAEGTTFTVCSTATEGGDCVSPVAGVVSYTNNTVAFNPDVDLANATWHKSSITAAATDLAGNALLVPPAVGSLPNPWNWQTGTADLDAPTITLTNPADLDTDVPLNKTINATFSEEMRQATITATNYTVMETATQVNVPGTVSYDVQHHIASFVPSSNLSPDTDYTVTVSDAVEDLAGNALQAGVSPNPWTFRTGETVVEPQALAINLGVAESFGIASRAGLTTTGVTVVNGDIALYPEASCTDATGNAGASQTCLVKTYVSSTGMTVNGSIYWAGDPYDDGATALAVTNDLNTAWVEGKNKADTFATGFLGGELGASSLPDGKILLPGVYHEAALGLAAGNTVTFDAEGDPNAIFIIKIDSSFVDSGIVGNETEVKLANGAQARNIWFIAGLDITIGQGTTWYGNILAGRTATINSGSAVSGRVLAGASGAGAITLTGADTSVTSISVPQ
ncbi:MAG: Ig-like domain-containing protein [Thiomicrospira sp.]|uniref:Ig-like domain-containing protein n=1 Tax=Thiomicrospira sp. TaxID=935 RepID=UPI0019E8CB99|nr:Ig-like domain-containing protein [Thiomicrospira sp.]MBE0493134.1 Ig-like domain-containing protein [Thiomicrospira sp.]